VTGNWKRKPAGAADFPAFATLALYAREPRVSGPPVPNSSETERAITVGALPLDRVEAEIRDRGLRKRVRCPPCSQID
jgi:hypothetical protein